MRTTSKLLAAVITALALPAAGAAAAPSLSPTGPAQVTLQQDRLLRAGEFKKLYGLFTTRFKQQCGYAKFQQQAAKSRSQLKGITLKVTGEQITGSRGIVKYKYLRGTKVLATITNDLYVKVGGRWLDEVDPVTSC